MASQPNARIIFTLVECLSRGDLNVREPLTATRYQDRFYDAHPVSIRKLWLPAHQCQPVYHRHYRYRLRRGRQGEYIARQLGQVEFSSSSPAKQKKHDSFIFRANERVKGFQR